MQIIKDTKLAQRLKEGNVPPKEQLYYFLFISFIACLPKLNSLLYLTGGPEPEDFLCLSTLQLIEDGMFLSEIFIAIPFLYYINSKGDNTQFLERYICLSFPIFFRTMLLVLIALSLASLLIDADSLYDDTSLSILYISSLCYYYYRTYKCFKIAAYA